MLITTMPLRLTSISPSRPRQTASSFGAGAGTTASTPFNPRSRSAQSNRRPRLRFTRQLALGHRSVGVLSHVGLLEITALTIRVDDAEAIVRRAILSWVGLCNSTERQSWREGHSVYAEDSADQATRRKYIGEGTCQFKCCTELFDTCSLRPTGQISLDMAR